MLKTPVSSDLLTVDLVAVESAVIKVAKKNGATLFLPSQFGFDFVVA
jgi:hypothetical protein